MPTKLTAAAAPHPPAKPSSQWCRISLVKGLETMVTEADVVEEYKRWLSVPWSHARERVSKARKARQAIRTARYRFEWRGGDAL